MSTVEKDITWYNQTYKYVQGGYRPEAWAAEAAGSLSRKHNACYKTIFERVYAAVK